MTAVLPEIDCPLASVIRTEKLPSKGNGKMRSSATSGRMTNRPSGDSVPSPEHSVLRSSLDSPNSNLLHPAGENTVRLSVNDQNAFAPASGLPK